jgi:hypothetical protein
MFVGIAAQGLASANAFLTPSTLYSDLPSWEWAARSWTETTSVGPLNSDINGMTLSDGTTLGFSQTVQIANIGSGWATWCCSYGGQVLVSYSTGSWTSEDWTISPVWGFGLFIEPDPFGVLDITMSLSDGGTLTQAVDGNAGAAFFGWVGTGVTSLNISSTSDFGVGDFFSVTPEPATFAPLVVIFAGLAFWQFKRRRDTAKA